MPSMQSRTVEPDKAASRGMTTLKPSSHRVFREREPVISFFRRSAISQREEVARINAMRCRAENWNRSPTKETARSSSYPRFNR